jgi:ketosteroid isomerase-like protein
VRVAFDAWNRGDHDAVLRVWDEGAAFYPLRAQLERRAYRGRDGLRRFFVELAEEWEEVRFEIDEIRDTGGQIVGLGRFQARGKGSGVEIDVPLGMVGMVRDRRSSTRASSRTRPKPSEPPGCRSRRCRRSTSRSCATSTSRGRLARSEWGRISGRRSRSRASRIRPVALSSREPTAVRGSR